MLCETLHLPQDKNKNEIKTKIVIILTVITMIAEIGAGLVFGSMALLSDGIHMGTHTLALLITVIAYKITRKEAKNGRFSFGTGKVGVLGGYTSAIALLIAAGIMIVESVERLFSPEQIGFDESIIVAVVGLAVNLLSAYLLRDEDHGHSHGHDHHHSHNDDHDHGHDHNLKAAYLHVIADALTSVLAIVALLIGRHYANAIWLDSAVGIVGAIVIIKWGIGLMKSSGSILLDYDNSDDLIQSVTELVAKVKGATLEDIHIWQVASDKRALICAISGDISASDASELRGALNNFTEFCHTTVSVTEVV